MSPADLLNAAADLIEQRGHNHLSYEDQHGRLCAEGALRIAHRGTTAPVIGEDDRPWKLARGMLCQHLPSRYGANIPHWNDESDAATVVATMRAAARGGAR